MKGKRSVYCLSAFSLSLVLGSVVLRPEPRQTVSRPTMVGTPQVQLVEGPIPCNTRSDAAEYNCLGYKAIVDADDPSSPLDDDLRPTHVLLVLRHKKDAPLTNRWVTFHSGGNANGYSSAFAGGTSPGEWVSGGQYGDDLIRWYNERGYVTLDVIWECRDAKPGDPCYATPFAGWVPHYPGGTGWYRNTGGAGYVGTASREKAVVEWAVANNGGHRVGSHAHSGGSGRLMITLTRYGGEALFDTVVFDGGPVFAYIPWYCGIKDDGDPSNGSQTPGPLGPKPAEYDIESYGDNLRNIYDNARDRNNGEGETRYRNCTNHVWDEPRMMQDSSFYLAAHRRFPTLDLAVVLGGRDVTPASPTARLWFNGYSHGAERIPALSARSTTIIQGYCDPGSGGTYTANRSDRPCSDWNATKFSGASEVRYEPTIAQVDHSTAASLEGARILFSTMLKTLEVIPEGSSLMR